MPYEVWKKIKRLHERDLFIVCPNRLDLFWFMKIFPYHARTQLELILMVQVASITSYHSLKSRVLFFMAHSINLWLKTVRSLRFSLPIFPFYFIVLSFLIHAFITVWISRCDILKQNWTKKKNMQKIEQWQLLIWMIIIGLWRTNILQNTLESDYAISNLIEWIVVGMKMTRSSLFK